MSASMARRNAGSRRRPSSRSGGSLSGGGSGANPPPRFRAIQGRRPRLPPHPAAQDPHHQPSQAPEQGAGDPPGVSPLAAPPGGPAQAPQGPAYGAGKGPRKGDDPRVPAGEIAHRTGAFGRPSAPHRVDGPAGRDGLVGAVRQGLIKPDGQKLRHPAGRPAPGSILGHAVAVGQAQGVLETERHADGGQGMVVADGIAHQESIAPTGPAPTTATRLAMLTVNSLVTAARARESGHVAM